jgi:o-succinylbenzoate synthase
MTLQAQYFKKVFKFNFKARTSRGLMKDKTSWFIKIWDVNNPAITGIGECSPLPGLSVDATPDYEDVLRKCVDSVSSINSFEINQLRSFIPDNYSSIMFGFETALLDLKNGGKRVIYENRFIHGEPIPINGLIWMGDMDFMMSQINEKIAMGYRCIKLKVGGLNFDRECDILSYIRKRYFRENITIRLDANGAFKTEDVLFRLDELAKYNVQSIEQPIKPGLAEMEELCRKSPIPVAFDEELIGITQREKKKELLQVLHPQHIILKPSLHGGIQHCQEWIEIAESFGISWWVTSALESSIGLNAICQFTANYPITLPQGLGTGQIYENNFISPLKAEKGNISYEPEVMWNESEFQHA